MEEALAAVGEAVPKAKAEKVDNLAGQMEAIGLLE